MAGERSKSIGEIGESIAENFFSKIGWGSPQKGVYYPCYNKKNHALKASVGGEKHQHGIDFQVSYKSTLESETLNNLLISVKHSKDRQYPKSATKEFKGYISDLVDSMQCFKRSPHYRDISSSHAGCRTINDIPVLFFISSKDNEHYDFTSHLQNSRFMNDYDDVKELYIIDNRKVSFILNVLNYIESHYPDYEWYFFHPSTGMNIGDINIRQHSKQMQIEFLTSPFIPFVLKKKIGDHETCKFFLASIDSFTQDNFSKLVTYCRNNTSDNISDVEISMHDYFLDDNLGDTRKVLSAHDIELDVKVSNYNPSFRSLANE
ncbi:GapS4a family protein [Shewanella woodyi]|uniref:GAPS4 PD-(D/E)XK nuclease domain-containing protein n=1 Tax=Shewanella woodyi (strain ATCC 51908 / MS32) TaxID=392500 RepID=B1KG01_SHEWM|nr:hypothetical protein [Shewanella woodyi]ACA86708.1 hypothetical protein Swoo_2430 [Shewanella woodyi ATCC 51908]